MSVGGRRGDFPARHPIPHQAGLDEGLRNSAAAATSYSEDYRGDPYREIRHQVPYQQPYQPADWYGECHHSIGSYADPRASYPSNPRSRPHAQPVDPTCGSFLRLTDAETNPTYVIQSRVAPADILGGHIGHTDHGVRTSNVIEGHRIEETVPPLRTHMRGGSDSYEGFGRPVDPEGDLVGVPSNNVISGRIGDVETLDRRYKKQPNPQRFFTSGKVFAILWHENAGRNGTVITHTGPFSTGRYGQPIYSTIRRMVVVAEFSQCAWCLPISTYSGQGVAKPGVNPQEHTIIHMRGSEPFAGKNEPRMTKDPLEVKPDSHDQKLDRMSRLNFGKVYTVEHNVKVMPVGSISRSSMPKLLGYARESFSRVGRSNEARYQHGRTPSAFAPAYNEFTLDNSHGYSAGTAAIVPDYFAHTSFHPPSSGR